MLDYQKPDRGWCGDPSRGAAMGRGSDLPFDAACELRIRQVHLDGDYDAGGTYWGGGPGTLPLFCVFDGEDRVRYLRAADYDAARAQFPHATWAAEVGPSEDDLRDMLDAYITAALWSSNDESDDNGGEPFDANYDSSDLADEARAKMAEDCKAFATANAATIAKCIGQGKCDWARAGHDFWLNRNGHGCGFWDGDWPKVEGKILDDACDAFGECYLYLGDDGKIYCD
jgi:hypothetical protein